jgi:hypothetical protein
MPFLDRNEPYIVDISHGLVVIFKPSGWHATLHEPGDVSVPSWLFEHYDLLPVSALKEAVQANALRIQGVDDRQEPDRFQEELGMLYRLDRDTSGILLCALERSTMDTMQKAQDGMALTKRYMLICTESDRGGVPGSMPESRHAERALLLNGLYAGRGMDVASYFRSYGPRGARVACIASEFAAKSKKKITRALYATRYLSVREAGAGGYALPGLPQHAMLVEAEIRKGFRHQIRAHSAWMGLPIVGDALYGGADAARLFLEAFAVTLYDGARIAAEWKLYSGD